VRRASPVRIRPFETSVLQSHLSPGHSPKAPSVSILAVLSFSSNTFCHIYAKEPNISIFAVLAFSVTKAASFPKVHLSLHLVRSHRAQAALSSSP